jgi:hypothetical protein
MAHPLCLQRWISLGGSNNRILAQDPSGWLDVSGYKDLVLYTEVAFVTDQAATTRLQIQTAPRPEGVLFAGGVTNAFIAEYAFSTSPGLGMQALKVLRWADGALTGAPLSRFLRWRVVFPAAETTINFRIWLNLNQAARC